MYLINSLWTQWWYRLHALMLKKTHSFSHTVPSTAPLLNTQSQMIGQLKHVHVPATLATTATRVCISNTSVWHGDVVWYHKVSVLKVVLLTRSFRHFRSSVFREREELPLVQTLGFLTVKIWIQTLKKKWKKTKKCNGSLSPVNYILL